MTTILAESAAEKRDLACQNWNERMQSDGGPIDPSPTVDRAINCGYGRLEIECSRCRAKRDVQLAVPRRVGTTCVHDLARRLIKVQDRRETPGCDAATA
jgi:hypothetical protein